MHYKSSEQYTGARAIIKHTQLLSSGDIFHIIIPCLHLDDMFFGNKTECIIVCIIHFFGNSLGHNSFLGNLIVTREILRVRCLLLCS